MISIHAPVKGATKNNIYVTQSEALFQSTHP